MIKKSIFLICLVDNVLFCEALSTIIVNEKNFEEKTSINQNLSSKDIENMVTNNADIPSLLKTNPNVKVIENKDDPSSIEPAKIEINNAKYYQNAFILDGLSADSLLDPNSYNQIDDVKGNENEIFLDLDLIESIKVLDSGISAQYGYFSGGVIDVKLKNPSDTHFGKIKYRLTNDSLTTIHVPNNKNHANQDKPSFKKQNINLTYQGAINQNSGIIASFSGKEGQKPTRYLNEYKNVKNSSLNFLLKYSRYLDGDGITDFNIMYFPYKNNNIAGRYIKNSEYTTKGGGVNLSNNFEKNFNNWRFNSNIALKTSENTRTTNTNYLKYWRKTDTKDWGNVSVVGEPISAEGSWGDIKKRQNSFLGNFKLEKEFEGHYINTGLQTNFIQGSHERLEELIIYKDPLSDSDIRCNGETVDCIGKEQFFTRRDIYQKENTKANMASLGYYIEDTYKMKFMDLRFGLRADYNSYLKNLNIAPRLNTQIHFFDKKTKFFVGANRYYGKSFLGYKLREARTPYKSEYRSKYADEINSNQVPNSQINPTIWNTSSDKGSDIYLFSKLKTPYTDEHMLGYSQAIANNVIKFKYVKREARDQFTLNKGERKKFTRPDGKIAYYFPKIATNKGKSSSKLYTITLQNIEEISFLSSKFNYSLSYRKSKNSTNFASYDSSDTENKREFFAIYNNKTIDINNLGSFKTPDNYTLLLNYISPNIGFLGLNNTLSGTLFFEYTPSYIKPVSTGEQTEIIVDGVRELASIYNDQKIKSRKNVDLRISLNTKINSKNNLIITADILNLLDSIDNDNSNSYQLRRQFWLGVEYRF